MRKRQVTFESLENRQLLDGGSIAVSDAPPQSQSGLLRYVANGAVFKNTDASKEVVAQHWPNESLKGNWRAEQAGDFNGDGLSDVFGQYKNGDSIESWLQLNDGEELFLLPWGEGLPRNTEIVGTGDVNGDGLTDVVSFNASTNEVWVSINDLDRGFHNQLWTRWSESIDSDVFIGDFDQDGLTDVLAGSANGEWLLGESTGTRFETKKFGRYVNYGWQDILTGDFNGDDFPDVAARAPDQTWWVWAGGGAGLSRSEYWGHWKMANVWYDVQVADFNADGSDDVIGRSEDGKLFVASSRSTDAGGEFRTWRWSKGWIFSADWRNVSIVDVTGDGLPDYVAQAKDRTWWLAENIGDNFRNSYLDRPTAKVESIIALPTLSNDLNASLFDRIPSPSERPAITATLHTPIRVSINSDSELVVTGTGQKLSAIEFRSASGSLIPLPEFGSITGFTELATNQPISVRLSTSDVVTLDGQLVLGVKWDEASAARDLVVTYDAVDVLAEVDAQLFAAVPVVNTHGKNPDEYRTIYPDALVWPSPPKTLVEPTSDAPTSDAPTSDAPTSDAPTSDEPTSDEPTGDDPTGDDPTGDDPTGDAPTGDDPTGDDPTDDDPTDDDPTDDDPTSDDPANSDIESEPTNLVESTELTFVPQQSGALALSLNDDNQFVVAATDALVYAIRIESPTLSLLYGDSPEPFEEILVSDAGLVVFASREPVAFDIETSLDLRWNTELATDQLIAEFASGNSEWFAAELFNERLSSSKSTELPSVESTNGPMLKVGIDENSSFVVSGDDQKVLGMNFISAAGGLIPGSSPKPFELFVSNTPEQVTLGTWGTLVSIKGSLTLDLGWDRKFDLANLVVEFGDARATVHRATLSG